MTFLSLAAILKTIEARFTDVMKLTFDPPLWRSGRSIAPARSIIILVRMNCLCVSVNSLFYDADQPALRHSVAMRNNDRLAKFPSNRKK
jgi:hypothetical protein